jgi:hypothetical protein
MTNRSKILALSLVLTGLAACSGMQEKSTYAAAQEVVSPTGEAIDQVYMANVEYVAKQRGVEVHWVNPPLKAVANSQ